MNRSSSSGIRAVVIGASVAGLAASSALAPYAQSVLLIDQDILPNGPENRRRVPQSEHVHALLYSGQMALADLFPGLEKLVGQHGGLRLKVRSQWRTYSGYSWMAPTDTGLLILSQSRAQLDWLLRRSVLTLPQVTTMQGQVRGFEIDAAENLSGVLVDDGNGGRCIRANLVVDASGRSGRSLEWLKAAGFSAPPYECSRPDISYASAFFTRSVDGGPILGGWLSLAQAPDTRSAVLAPIEGNRWMATAIGRFGDKMPGDADGLLACFHNLPDRRIVELLEEEELLSDIRRFHVSTTCFHRFDAAGYRSPGGYLPIGDTVATLNPIYAQGMSVAALQARSLARILERHDPDRLQQSYLQAAIGHADRAWRLGQAMDLAYPQFIGTPNPEIEQLHTALRTAFAASIARPDLRARVDQVFHLLEPPEILFRDLARTGRETAL